METGRGSSTGNHPNGAQDTHGGHGAPEHRGGGRIADLVSPQGALPPRPTAEAGRDAGSPEKAFFRDVTYEKLSFFRENRESAHANDRGILCSDD